MTEFLGTKIDFIEPGEAAWRHKINMNFSLLAAVKLIGASQFTANVYTCDTVAASQTHQYDHTLVVDVEGTNRSIVLPSSSDAVGRQIVVIRRDPDSETLTVKPASGDYLQGTVDNTAITVAKCTDDTTIATRLVFTCIGIGSTLGWWASS